MSIKLIKMMHGQGKLCYKGLKQFLKNIQYIVTDLLIIITSYYHSLYWGPPYQWQ